jgi:hypothetical protein
VTDLALVCADFAAAFARQPLRLPSLERLLAYSRGVTTTSSDDRLDAWQCELLDVLGVPDRSAFPSAPLTWLGATGAKEEGMWLHADPAWMSMSAQGLTLDRVHLWSAAQLPAIEALLQDHLAHASMRWRVGGGRAYLRRTAPLDASTTSPRHAAHGELRDKLPRGRDAAELRRLMTELQMLLHDKFGPSAPNAIWLWGAGRIPDAQPMNPPPLWTDDHYAQGVYAIAASDRANSLPKSLDAVLSSAQSPRAAVLIHTADLDDTERNWFEPALRALHSGRLNTIDLYLDGRQAHAERSILRRWFARPRALAEWFA